jgi:hypothetical protein
MYIFCFLFTGAQHRPLLQQHLENVKKQIDQEYGNLNDSDRSLFLEVVQDCNITQLQHDLAIFLMTLKQVFVHIIVYDPRSVKNPATPVVVHVLVSNSPRSSRVSDIFLSPFL